MNAELRSQPNSGEAERAVIGAILTDSRTLDDVVATLEPSDFYWPANATIYEAILALRALGARVDAVTVADHLQRAGRYVEVGGPSYLIDVQAGPGVRSNVARYAQIVHDHAVARAMIRFGAEASETGWSAPTDVQGALDTVEQGLLAITRSALRGDGPLSPAAQVAEYQSLMESPIDAVPTGYTELDRLWNGGLTRGDMHTVAARSGLGKTAVALGIAVNVARAGHPVLFHTLEMSRSELMHRAVSYMSGVWLRRLVQRRVSAGLDISRRDAALAELAELPLYIVDDPAPSVAEMKSNARRIIADHGSLGLLVDDYVQLHADPKGRFGTRQEEVASFSRALKVAAKELDCPVMVLAQLNREVDRRTDRRPTNADLRESAALEQDASKILMVYRDGFYEPEFCDNPTVAEWITTKHRNGATGKVYVRWMPELAAYMDDPTLHANAGGHPGALDRSADDVPTF